MLASTACWAGILTTNDLAGDQAKILYDAQGKFVQKKYGSYHNKDLTFELIGVDYESFILKNIKF